MTNREPTFAEKSGGTSRQLIEAARQKPVFFRAESLVIQHAIIDFQKIMEGRSPELTMTADSVVYHARTALLFMAIIEARQRLSLSVHWARGQVAVCGGWVKQGITTIHSSLRYRSLWDLRQRFADIFSEITEGHHES